MKEWVWTDEEGKTETVQNLIEKLFSYAMTIGVSDIHAEPLDETFRIRCRRDGVLQSVGAIRKEKGKAFINRLKVMAALDIADARRPQDGRIVYKEGIDMRLSTMPTVRGEKAVIRILGGSRNLPTKIAVGALAAAMAIGGIAGLNELTGRTASAEITIHNPEKAREQICDTQATLEESLGLPKSTSYDSFQGCEVTADMVTKTEEELKPGDKVKITVTTNAFGEAAGAEKVKDQDS